MAAALDHAKRVAGVTVSTGGYSVWRASSTPQDQTPRWQASQTLELHGRESEPLLVLVGSLQQKGLAVGQLGWRLSEMASQEARERATRGAIDALQARAKAVADQLHMTVASIRELRLDGTRPVPMPRAMMAAAPASAPAPSAEPEDVPVSVTAEADVVLDRP